MIVRIQKGEDYSREQIISEYMPFIIKSVSKICNKYIEVENSEELSIGLIAFNEAINCFNHEKNDNFINFSYMVIKRRLLNYKKQQSKDNEVILLSTYEDSQKGQTNYGYDTEFEINPLEQIEINDEFSIFKRELKEYDITLEDLVLCAPKHRDSRLMCLELAKQIVQDTNIFSKLKKNKGIPIKELLQKINVYRGTIEKNRKYIISLCLIMDSQLEILQGFISDIEKGGNANG